MTNREKIEFLYKEDGIRNEVFLNDLLHDDFVLDWDSSQGNVKMFKQDIINLASELNQNYIDSFMEISHIIEENNKLMDIGYLVTCCVCAKKFYSIFELETLPPQTECPFCKSNNSSYGYIP